MTIKFTDAEKEGYNVKPKKVLSEEHKQNISLALKGNTNVKGKKWHTKSLSQNGKGNLKNRIFEGKSLSEWSRELGVTRELTRQRMNRWGTVHADQIATIKAERQEAKLSIRRQEKARLHKEKIITVQGKTVNEWAIDQGVTSKTIYDRLKTKGSPYKRLDIILLLLYNVF